MSELVWDDGMSVGIDAIDEDHKQIIDILAKLTATRYQNISKEMIADIFLELENYVVLHFAREEKLLEEINYKDLAAHKISHQKFVDKLPILKQEWLAEDNIACCEKIITFLNSWLVNHIFKDDFDYIPALQNTFSTPTSNKSMHARFAHFIGKNIKLSTRVFLIAFIPVVGVLLLSLVVIQNNYQQYKNMSLLLSLNDVIMQVDNLSHSLQVERGLSSGLVSSSSQPLTKYLNGNLKTQRVITDQAIVDFLALMTNEINPLVKINIKSYFELVRYDLKKLSSYRQQLDNKSQGFLQTHQLYTLLIKRLLSISENLRQVEMNSQLANHISAISSILMFKEYMGQIRATGMNLINTNDVHRLEQNNIDNNLEINQLLGKQLHALRVFNYSANSQQKQACLDFCNEINYRKTLKQAFLTTMANKTTKQRSQYWFNYMSAEINKLKQLTGSLTVNLKNSVSAQSQELRIKYLVSFFVLSAFLFGMILFSSILNFSIISPIRYITRALNNMAKGNLTTHFNDPINNDEIGAMHTAYEGLRRNLLQVNVFKAMIDSQEEEIAYSKSQQEHFKTLAYTDALTGAVNRHQFNILLDKEILQVNEQQQHLSILLLDIDYFKQINDNFGHGVGDDVLIMFYNVCKQAVRSGDVVARIGGEEFVIVLPKTDVHSAHQFAERLRAQIENLDITIDENIINVTVSIGVSQWQSNAFCNAKAFVADADKLLYKAKNQGRNKVVSA